MATNSDLSNIEVVTLVVHLLGGSTRPIDTEDIAINANEIAPGRFVWRKYPNQINLQDVRFALENGTRKQCSYLIGKGSEGWMLTEAGNKFAVENVRQLKDIAPVAERKSSVEETWAKRERQRMLSSEALEKFNCGKIDAITSHEAAGFFRIDEYVTGDTRERKLARIINRFGEDLQLGEAVRALAQRVREDSRNE